MALRPSPKRRSTRSALASSPTTRTGIILVGGTGTGKTHISIALGTNLVNQGKRARFHNAVDLINALIAEQADGNTGKIIKQLSALDCVIIDELGFRAPRKIAPILRPGYSGRRVSWLGGLAMAQMGFFDPSDRHASLDAKRDPLVEVDAVVPWEAFRPTLERFWRKPEAERKSRAGRNAKDSS